ncbi:hypothetical protein WA026_009034 [Henosepilachna vigintioctopunctata]|uniref:Ras-GEF domain-containing protein n=1 Tax=Henosepilachna vigintioctopunctata TaxID=420089 RepID=A0AAW1UUP7_9CUCU
MKKIQLEKRIPLTAQKNHRAELEELQDLLHFPEEVALRLADTEYQLYYQVPPIQYMHQVTSELGIVIEFSVDGLPSNVTPGLPISTLINRFNEVSSWVTQLIISQPTHDARRAVLSCVLRVALYSWNIANFNGAMEIIAGLQVNSPVMSDHFSSSDEDLEDMLDIVEIPKNVDYFEETVPCSVQNNIWNISD